MHLVLVKYLDIYLECCYMRNGSMYSYWYWYNWKEKELLDVNCVIGIDTSMNGYVQLKRKRIIKCALLALLYELVLVQLKRKRILNVQSHELYVGIGAYCVIFFYYIFCYNYSIFNYHTLINFHIIQCDFYL